MRLLIVEDHGLIAGALLERICAKRAPQTHARVRTLAEAETLLAQQTVDLIFLDLMLPDAFGLGALRALRQLQPAARVVIYSGEADPQIARDAAECGAFAFIPKSLDEDELNAALHDVLRGTPVFPVDVRQPPAHNKASTALHVNQRDVLKGVLLGLTNKQIAAQARLSPKQVKRAIEELLARFDVPDRRRLAEYIRTQADQPSVLRGPVKLGW